MGGSGQILHRHKLTVSGTYLPKILLVKNTAIKLTISETYRDFVIIYICGVPGVLAGALMYGVPRVGRKWAMVVSSALMGVSFFVFSTVNTEASNIGLNILEYFFQRYGIPLTLYFDPAQSTCSRGSFLRRHIH